MLALLVVNTKALVIISGYFVFQIEMGVTFNMISESRGIHSPQCLHPDLYIKYTMSAQCGFRTRGTGMLRGSANHYIIRYHLDLIIDSKG